MQATAVVLDRPERIALRRVGLNGAEASDLVVDTLYSGVSTGTERLLWSGRMPSFPGLGYPLIPGYETVGRVARAPADSGLTEGDTVFVPGAACFGEIRGLFGGAASRLITDPKRVAKVDPALGPDAVLMALAATAHHAIAGHDAPELIVGHGALGRLLARLTIALGHAAPAVWETLPGRREGATGYTVTAPDDDPRRDYRVILDASGDPSGLDTLIQRLAPRGELVLAGFYADPVSFAYPPAFMREARFRIAAEWQPHDLTAVRDLVAEGRLSLDGLVTHKVPATQAPDAYATAFTDPDCLKLILDWRDA